ncbi:MAG TPA: serine/threonine-protein kinase [Kofleriaceae bacterium]
MAEAHSFGRYRVTGTLGSGAMGEVYVAVDDVLGREVAVKTLRKVSNGLGARLLDERFRQEARAIAALAHPGVVQVFDFALDADPPYLVMERAAGPSLKERITDGALPVSELRGLGIQVANALAAAHAAGIVHRDVKPANILAAGAGRWKLADFGVAHVPDSSLTMTGQFVGSPAYAPPEALVRGDAGPPGDIYGLGATLYEAAAGRWPRRDAPSGAVLAPVPPVRELVPHLPDEIASAIDRAVSLEAAARPSAVELAETLAGGRTSSPSLSASLPGVSAASLTGIGSAPVRAATPAPPWRKWVIASVVLIVVISIIAAVTTGSSGSKATSPAAKPEPVRPRDRAVGPPPNEIRAEPPPIAERGGKAGKDWNKLVDHLYRNDFGEALDKLVEFETKHGSSEETRSLRQQLEAIPEHLRDDERGD